jgi:mono/diheme cytochrome c family protein
MLMRNVLLMLLVGYVLGVAPAFAGERVLTLSFGGEQRRMTAAELLARPDAASIAIPNDVSYRRAMTYRAVPLLALIGGTSSLAIDTIEARASDGFASMLPATLVTKGAAGGAVAWVAVEDPDAPWPNLPGQNVSGGPFYLVWEHPERSDVGPERWPFALAALTGVEDPVRRWPQLAVDPALPDDAAERRGQAVFVKNCMSCHRMMSAGQGEIGPDLGQPMNVTAYMTPSGIRAIIRAPKAVRTWPRQQMIGFDAATISDVEIDALIAFLAHMATR